MGLFSRGKPKIKVQSSRKDSFSGWLKCTECDQLVHDKELEKTLQCCPKCSHHYRLGARDRLALLTDEGTFEELFENVRPVDALNFVDSEPYPDRLAAAQKKTGLSEGVIVGRAMLDEQPIAIGAIDFSFMGGSMGSVVGERITRLMEYALEQSLPLIFVSSSGGARMQESILSLMQMAKTSAALSRLRQRGIPYISILTHPTSGGVTASFAALGDVILAEPKALICFAGPRVIEQTIRQKLPKGAQRSEFLLDRGMIDAIVPRAEMRKTVSQLVGYMGEKAARLRERKVITKFPEDAHATAS
jgi:acetyl-CoA carboxylase carboxyl transferase subunit beta